MFYLEHEQEHVCYHDRYLKQSALVRAIFQQVDMVARYKPHILHYSTITSFQQGLSGHTKDKIQILIIFLKKLIKKSKQNHQILKCVTDAIIANTLSNILITDLEIRNSYEKYCHTICRHRYFTRKYNWNDHFWHSKHLKNKIKHKKN